MDGDGGGGGGWVGVYKCGVKHEASDIHAASQQAPLNEAQAMATRGAAIETSAVERGRRRGLWEVRRSEEQHQRKRHKEVAVGGGGGEV